MRPSKSQPSLFSLRQPFPISSPMFIFLLIVPFYHI